MYNQNHDEENHFDQADKGKEGVAEVEQEERPSTSFPIHCLPQSLRQYATAISEDYDLPVEIPAVSILASVGGAIGKGLITHWETFDECYGNLYVLVGAPPSTGKTNTVRPMYEPWKIHQNKVVEVWKFDENPKALAIQEELMAGREQAKKQFKDDNDSQTYREALIAINQEEAKNDEILGKEPVRWIQDITTAELEIMLSQNQGALFSIAGESQNILRNLRGRHSGGETDNQTYLNAFSGEFIKTQRRGREEVTSVDNPRLSMLWMMQTHLLHDLAANKDFQNTGFIQRCLFTVTDFKRTPRERGRTSKHKHFQTDYNRLILSLLTAYREQKESLKVEMPSGVQGIFSDYDDSNIQSENEMEMPVIKESIGRNTEIAIRIGLVLHAMKHTNEAHTIPIQFATAKEAVEVMEWFHEQKMNILLPIQEEKEEELLEKVIDKLRTAGGKKSQREVCKSIRGLDQAHLDSLLETYPLRIQKVKDGRKTFIVLVDN